MHLPAPQLLVERLYSILSELFSGNESELARQIQWSQPTVHRTISGAGISETTRHKNLRRMASDLIERRIVRREFLERGQRPIQHRNGSQEEHEPAVREHLSPYDAARDVIAAEVVVVAEQELVPLGRQAEFPGFFAEETSGPDTLCAFEVPAGWLLALPKIGPGDLLLLDRYAPPQALSALYRAGMHDGYYLMSRGLHINIKLLKEVAPHRIAVLNTPDESDPEPLQLDAGHDAAVHARVLWIERRRD